MELNIYSLKEANLLEKYSNTSLREFLENSPHKDLVIGDETGIYATKIEGEIDIFDLDTIGEKLGGMEIYFPKKMKSQRVFPWGPMKKVLPNLSKRLKEELGISDLLIEYKIPQPVVYRSNGRGNFGPKKGIRAKV